MTELSEILHALKGIQAELQQANKTLSAIAAGKQTSSEAAPRAAAPRMGRPAAGRPARPAYGKPAGSSRGAYRADAGEGVAEGGSRYPSKKTGYPKSGKPGPKGGPKKGGFRSSK